MSDISIMDYFLSKTNEKQEYKTEPDMDISSNYDNSELMSSDFFDSILSLEKTNLDECVLDSGLFDKLEMDMNMTSDGSVTYDDMQCETSTFSDSGLSSDLQEIPDQILSDDELLKSILDVPNAIQVEQPCVDVKPVEYVRPIITEPDKPKIINIIKPIQKSKQVIRVQPLNANSRSVLLPINIKDLKTIKIINTSNLKAENIKFTSSAVRQTKKITHKFIADVKDNVRRPKEQGGSLTTLPEENGTTDEDVPDNQYPLLLLTPEEKRLLSKDGIQLPCRYPLTKYEERELKRIRRKIRNKISAQDSRKRKKEYVDGLEERVKQCSEENRSLLKRIKLLQLQNNKLSTQLSKLQALVFKTGTSRAHPATCLMIVLLSVMLVTLPNLRGNNASGTAPGAVDKELNTLQQYVARRALLFSPQATSEDAATLNMDEFITFPSSKKTNTAAVDEDVSDIGNSSAKNKFRPVSAPSPPSPPVIDYAVRDNGGGRYLKHGTKRFLEPDIDDHWPPEKKPNIALSAATGRANRFNRTEYYE